MNLRCLHIDLLRFPDKMVSEDFRTLMKKVHVDGLKVASVEVNFQRINEGFSEKVEIALVGGEMREIFRSVESDVVDYAFHLQSIVGSGGKVTLAPVKDLNRYFKDVDHLVDQDNSKLEAAIKE